MKAWVVVAISIWVILESARAKDDFTLDLVKDTKKDYKKFLTNLRTYLKDPKIHYGGTNIPVMAAPTTPETYFRIGLKGDDGRLVSLAVQKSSIYIIGYLTKNDQGQYRAYYFPGEITSKELDKLFPEAKGEQNQEKITKFKEDYASLESAAKKTRKDLNLGLKKLDTLMKGVYGTTGDPTIQNEAEFILASIQLTAEATRFKYIENLAVKQFDGFKLDDTVIIFEKNWETCSKAIQKSVAGLFIPPLVLSAGPDLKNTYDTVDELEMGILKYVGKG